MRFGKKKNERLFNSKRKTYLKKPPPSSIAPFPTSQESICPDIFDNCHFCQHHFFFFFRKNQKSNNQPEITTTCSGWTAPTNSPITLRDVMGGSVWAFHFFFFFCKVEMSFVWQVKDIFFFFWDTSIFRFKMGFWPRFSILESISASYKEKKTSNLSNLSKMNLLIKLPSTVIAAVGIGATIFFFSAINL